MAPPPPSPVLQGWRGLPSLVFTGRVPVLALHPIPCPSWLGFPDQKWQGIVRSLGSPPLKVVAEAVDARIFVVTPRRRAEGLTDMLLASGPEHRGGGAGDTGNQVPGFCPRGAQAESCTGLYA